MKTLRLLSVGNSFSDDMHQYMYDILKENGIDSVIANLYIGGCTQDMHYENIKNDAHDYCYKVYSSLGYKETYNYSIKDALNEKWDIMTLQQGSHKSGNMESFIDKETGVPYVNLIHDYLIDNYKYRNDIKFYYHSTWSYATYFKSPNFEFYHSDQNYMGEKIVECIREYVLDNPIFDGIIPNYYSVKLARDEYSIDANRDGFHLSFGFGRYLAGLTACMTILNKVPKNSMVSYENVTAEEKNTAHKIVEELYKNRDNLYK